MYIRIKADLAMLKTCLLGFATASPEIYASEVAMYAQIIDKFVSSLDSAEQGIKPSPFTTGERKDLIPIYYSIFSPWRGKYIGNYSAIRHFVLHATMNIREDVQTIKVQELLQKAQEKRTRGLVEEKGFDPIEISRVFGYELMVLEKFLRLRHAIAPLSGVDVEEYRQKQSGNNSGLCIKPKSAFEAMETEAASLAYTKMLKASLIGVQEMLQIVNLTLSPKECNTSDFDLMRMKYTKREYIGRHVRKVYFLLRDHLSTIFPVNLACELIGLRMYK